MSLRVRLTFLNTFLAGGVLFLVSVAIYSLFTLWMKNRIDETLVRAEAEIRQVTRVNSRGELDVITLPPLDLSTNVFMQAWGRNGRLRASSQNIENILMPLDPSGLQSAGPVFREAVFGDAHLRVLTVPLVVGDHPAGTLQLGVSLAILDEAQRVLLLILPMVWVVSIGIVAFASWVSMGNLLAPLEAVTQQALEITQSNDLSRRVPVKKRTDYEIRRIVMAVNQTLSRLERIVNSQRRFLTDVGHELRTPLTVIKGNVDLIRKMGGVDDESLTSVESEVERLIRLVGDLLLLAQAEAGKLPLDRRLIELDTILLEVYRQSKILAQERLQIRLGDVDQVLVCGDADRLRQVLLNLLGNAIKYTPEGGTVVVSVGKVGNRARLTVSDNGPGIQSQDLPHIFERFYRGEKSRKRSVDGQGFGLGLSIAYWIVRGHGGRIDVDSQEGRGTTFLVWLPLAEGDCRESPSGPVQRPQ